MTASSLYESWVNSLAHGFRNEGLTCQIKTDGTACPTLRVEFLACGFLFIYERLMEELCQLLKNN